MAKTKRLARVAMETLDSESVALVLTNEDRKVFRTAIGPEGLTALFQELVKCIGLWAAKPALPIDTLVGPKNSIAAQKISFRKGRNSGEIAVRMHLCDKVQMVFLMPLDALSVAILELDRSLEPTPPDATSH
jgi:hypothetical protein